MGYPANSYNLFKAILLEKNLNQRQPLNDHFELFAFILHDSEMHKDFHNKISERFDDLDKSTGEKMLFLAVLDPPNAWLKRTDNRSHHAQLRGWDSSWDRRAVAFENAIKSVDNTAAVRALAVALSIPPEQLPVVVYTTDFRNSEFKWFQTGVNTIAMHLNTLGAIAQHQQKEALMSRISEDIPSSETTLQNCLAAALAEVLCFVAATSLAGNEAERAATDARNVLSRLLNDIQVMKSNSNETLSEELEKLYLVLAHNIRLNREPGLTNTNTWGSQNLFAPIEPFVHPESWQMVVTALHYQNYVALSAENRLLDYSPAVICLAKAFENEVNNSLVQWLRHVSGIPMPLYFSKYAEGREAIVSINDSFKVDLNKKRGSSTQWLPPTLGNALDACGKVVKCRTEPRSIVDLWPSLSSQWRALNDLRNNAAHARPLSQADEMKMMNIMKVLVEGKIFETFRAIQDGLSSTEGKI